MSNVAKQRINYIRIHYLKNLRDVKIDFSPDASMVTGIFGPNGCGKSTILHLLACCYKPATARGRNQRFSDFFLPTSTHLWSGSAFTVNYSEKPQNKDPERTEDLRFEKKKDRWTPRYESRPTRDCRYLGINTCVPRIERKTQSTRIRFTGTSQPQQHDKILQQASFILNRPYTAYEVHSTGRAGSYIGVAHANQRYTELSMGAGEQRVFKILEIINSLPKHSLLLIDEIDLLLHEGALRRLMAFLQQWCKEKTIQLVFTAHRETLLDLDGINFRHIVQAQRKTFCIEDNTPHTVFQLTEKQMRYLKIHVEDDLAEALTNKALEELGVRRNATILRYGAATNAFVLAGAHSLEGTINNNYTFVLDGDVYREESEREAQIKQIVSGNDAAAKQARDNALAAICQFSLPPSISPEKYIWQSLRQKPTPPGAGAESEIVSAAKFIHGVRGSHDYVNEIINHVGYERGIGLSRIVDVFASTAQWEGFVSELKDRVTHNLPKSGIPDEPPEPVPPDVDHDVIVALTQDGHISCHHENGYDTADIEDLFALWGGSTTESIMLFSNRGHAYGSSIEALMRHSDGIHVSVLLGLRPDERIVGGVSADPRFMLEFAGAKPNLGEEYEEPYPHFLAVSKKGKAFRFCGWDHKPPGKRTSRSFGKLAPGDEFVDVIQVYAENDVAVLTRDGKLMRCNSMEINLVKGPAAGIKIVTLSGSDEVVGAWNASESRDVHLVSGTIELVNPAACTARGRGSKGVTVVGPVHEFFRPPPQVPDFDLGLQKLIALLS